MTILIIFLIWIAAKLIISLLAPFFIPYYGIFAFPEILHAYNLPHFIRALANFDGVHYLRIAQSGYAQFEQVFFPLYPLLMRTVGLFNREYYLVAGIIISNVAFFLGLLRLRCYLRSIGIDKKTVLWILAFIFLFPTSFFFGAVYTEGLFFLCFAGSLAFFHEKKYKTAALFALSAGLTKFIGVFLVVYFFTVVLMERWLLCHSERSHAEGGRSHARGGRSEESLAHARRWEVFLVILAPLIGFVMYALYLWNTTGNPFTFFFAQSAFPRTTSTIIALPQVYVRYIKIFITAQQNFQYFIAAVEFLLFNLILLFLLFHLRRLLTNRKSKHYPALLGLNVFSLINLILPTLTGTFSSIPRYGLMSLAFFVALGAVKNKWVKILIGFLFFILHLILFSFFLQGYFVS